MSAVFLSFVLLFSLQVISALVPQVPLCNWDGCPTVSRIGLGTLHLGDKLNGLSDPTKIRDWIQNGVSNGITLFDTADVYPVKGGNAGDAAKLFGQALKLSPGLRNKIQIVAKMGIIFPSLNQTYAAIDTSAEHILSTVDWFLSTIQTDYLDVILLHYPNSFMNTDEVAQTFASLKASGKVRNFGVSNHYPSHFKALQAACDKVGIKLVTNEVEISVWNPRYLSYNAGTVDHAYSTGYRNLAWGALAGDSTGGFNRLFTKKGVRQAQILSALEKVGSDLGVLDASVVALAWTLSHPSGIIPLIGTTKNDRVNNLVAAIDLAPKIDTLQWWKIAGKGGLCALADDQCDYDEYK